MNQELSANTNLSHYRIVSKLGAGGMGEVWLAEDTRLDRKVALKLLPAEFTQDADRVRRFMQEAKAASALNHPNIITVYDIGESEAGRFIVMELVEGRTLRAIIAEDNSLETLLALCHQIAKALSAAHAAGITHRDIKPDNIMVRDDGYVKVLDFGLARLLHATASDTETATLAQQTMPGQLMGTVAYMSPEQASGQSVNSPSDIFSLGIVLYELATGQHPFKAETLVGYLSSITMQTPLPLSQVKPRISVPLNALIMRMLEKDASRRPTASEVARGMQELERQGASSISGATGGGTQILEASLTPGSVDIAHVLFCDIVGYSILPIDRQKRIISALQNIVRQTEDYRRSDSRGQLVRLPAGDGMALAFLQDPVAPVRCAFEIARALKERPEIRLRMGVHSGPVFLSTDINGTRNVVGSGINMAQRVMDSGDAGHILVSRNVAEVLGQISQWQPLLRDLGEHEVKHGVRIHLFSIYNDEVGNATSPQKLLRSLAVDKQTEAPTETTKTAPAAHIGAARADEGFWVAVLPFKCRGAQADLEALAEGLTEDIVTGLSRFSYLRVIASSSTQRYVGDSGDVRSIGKELGARYVMEGNLRQAGTKLRLAVQLVDAVTGAHLWAENYERSFSPDAVFELQDDLAPRIVSTVADWYGALPHSMSEAVRQKPPDQLSPYEAVLRSFGYFEQITPEEHAAVRAGLERAVEQSPGNADGWAMLSMIYGEEHRFGFNALPDSLGRSLQAAQRAVDAAHANHFAWLALAQALFFRKEFDSFRDAAERAIALNPMDGSTLEYLGHLISFSGDWERGCDVAERARQLNPNHPSWYWSVPFLNAYRKGDYHSARAFLLKGNLQRNFLMQALLLALYGQIGEREAAAQALRDLLNLKPDFALTAREELGNWYLPELVEQLMDGLRKAGLDIVEAERATAPQLAADSSGISVSPVEIEKKQSAIQPTASPAQSIAVLPFANISADEENEYFCDGLAEELLNALAKIDDLNVAARTSAFSFKGKNAEAREIGKALNVNTVLEGSVRKSGYRVRITVQLVNTADGYHLWSERYDREMKDIFDIQDEITLAVVDALKLKLFGVEKAAVLKRYTDDAEVHELFLKGRYYYNKYTAEGWKWAIEFFEKAIEIQPDYAPAHAGIASSRGCLWFFGLLPAEQTIPQARTAASRALEIDGNLADAHLSLALITFFYDWEWGKAEQQFKRAITHNPNSAEALSYYAMFLGFAERFDEATCRGRRALEIDPLSPLINMNVGWTYFSAGLLDEAFAQANKIIEIEPQFYGAYWLTGAIYLSEGEYQKAIEELKKAVSLGGRRIVLADLGSAYSLAGKKDEAATILDQLLEMRREYVPAICLARLYSRIGENDKAISWLEKAFEERNGEMVFLKGEIAGAATGDSLNRLGDDPKVQNLLRKMDLP